MSDVGSTRGSADQSPPGIFGPAVRVPPDVSAAEWIAPTLGPFGSVGGLVPQGYEQYLLLDFRGEQPRGFAGVSELFEELAAVLASYTATPDNAWFAIWDGYGFTSFTTVYSVRATHEDERRALESELERRRDEEAQQIRAIRAALSSLPTFDLPDRRYYLVRGAVTAASQIEQPSGRFQLPPDLWWPDDRQWFVGGDTDLDWCYVAGSARLVSVVADAFAGLTRPVDWSASNAAAGART
jgi:hypothetical protein